MGDFLTMRATRRKRPGRPPSIDAPTAVWIGMAMEAQIPAQRIARLLGVSRRTICRLVEAMPQVGPKCDRLKVEISDQRRFVLSRMAELDPGNWPKSA
jgi:hypothetical protein